MPTLTDEELAAAIAAGEILAVALDTSVFDRYGKNLSHRTLRSLEQFSGTNTNVIFPDVIVGEIKSHIIQAARKTVEAVRSALVEHGKVWRRTESADELGTSSHLDQDPIAFAELSWNAFAKATDAIIIPADGNVTFTDLLNRYFSETPPFSSMGKKKAEFPDAIALLSIESWATAHSTKVLLISNDGDWQAFAAESSNLVCVKDVPEAIDPFNREAHFVAERIVAMLIDKKAPDLDEELSNAVERFFDDSSMDIEARTNNYDYEAELKGGALQYWTLSNGPSVLRADETQVTFVVDLECKISFDAEFTWLVSAGNDWQSVGSTDVTAEDDCLLQMTITCMRAIGDQPEVVEAEVTSRRVRINFGDVDPGWDYEE